MIAYKKDQKDKKQAAANRKQQKAMNEPEKNSENAETNTINNEDPVDMECSTNETVAPDVLDNNIDTSSCVPPMHEPSLSTDSSHAVLNS